MFYYFITNSLFSKKKDVRKKSDNPSVLGNGEFTVTLIFICNNFDAFNALLIMVAKRLAYTLFNVISFKKLFV